MVQEWDFMAEQKVLREQNKKMRLTGADMEQIKALDWILFIKDQDTFGLEKILLSTLDVSENPHVNKCFRTMLDYAEVLVDPSPPGNVIHVLNDEILWRDNCGMQVPKPWLASVEEWSLFAEWGYERVPHREYFNVRTVASDISTHLRAKDLKSMGIKISHIIFVNSEQIH